MIYSILSFVISSTLVAAIKYDIPALKNTWDDTGKSEANTLDVGILAPLSVDKKMKKSIQRMLGFVIATNQINANNSILPDRQMKVHWKDTEASVTGGFLRGMEFVGVDYRENKNDTSVVIKEMDMIYGPLSGDIAEQVGELFQMYKLPMVANAGTTSLTANNPMFNRISGNGIHHGAAFTGVARYFKWAKVILAHSNSAGSMAMMAGVVSQAEKYGDIEVLRIPILKVGSKAKDLDEHVEAIKLLESTIVFLAIGVSEGMELVKAMYQHGMTGHPWQFLTCSSFSITLQSLLRNDGEYDYGIPGAFIMSPYGPVPGDGISDGQHIAGQFMDGWDQWLAANKTQGIGATPYSPYAYDAAWLTAYAFDAYYKWEAACPSLSSSSQDYKDKCCAEFAHGDKQGEIINHIIRNNVTFQGASGEVDIMDDGERTKILYAVYNCEKDAAACHYAASIENGDTMKWFQNGDVVYWPDGSKGLANAPVHWSFVDQAIPTWVIPVAAGGSFVVLILVYVSYKAILMNKALKTGGVKQARTLTPDQELKIKYRNRLYNLLMLSVVDLFDAFTDVNAMIFISTNDFYKDKGGFVMCYVLSAVFAIVVVVYCLWKRGFMIIDTWKNYTSGMKDVVTRQTSGLQKVRYSDPAAQIILIQHEYQDARLHLILGVVEDIPSLALNAVAVFMWSYKKTVRFNIDMIGSICFSMLALGYKSAMFHQMAELQRQKRVLNSKIKAEMDRMIGDDDEDDDDMPLCDKDVKATIATNSKH
jgi:hypothetical protein